MTSPTIWCKKIETYVKLPHFCDKLVETELKDIFLFRSNSLKVLIFTSYGWSISENGMMSANISRDSQYFHHISLKYLRWATFVLSLKVAAFVILEKSRGAFLPPSRFKEDPPKNPILLRVNNVMLMSIASLLVFLVVLAFLL